mgnify:FL=1
MTGLGTGVVNGLLGAGGYDFENLFVQSDGAKNMVVWCFLALELICYAVLIVIMLFTNVEMYVKQDHETILAHQKAAVIAAGGEWIEPSERLRQEQEQADLKAEETRKEELRAYCQKTGLNFEEAEASYQEKIVKKQEQARLRAERKGNKK